MNPPADGKKLNLLKTLKAIFEYKRQASNKVMI